MSVVAADLSSDAGLKLVGSSVGDLDVLVNNAGAIPPGTLQEIDDRQWREAWYLKVFGYISLTRSLYAKLKGRQGKSSTSSAPAARTFRPDYIAGATGNAALMAFTRALGKSAAQDQMRVVGIIWGPVSTPRNEVMLRAKAKAEFGDESRWTELERGPALWTIRNPGGNRQCSGVPRIPAVRLHQRNDPDHRRGTRSLMNLDSPLVREKRLK